MADHEPRQGGVRPEADERAERLAQALRANLKRRKDQARRRDVPSRRADEPADKP